MNGASYTVVFENNKRPASAMGDSRPFSEIRVARGHEYVLFHDAAGRFRRTQPFS